MPRPWAADKRGAAGMIAAAITIEARAAAELLGPLDGPFVASGAALTAWAHRAPIGQRTVYARGVRLARMAEGAERARYLSDHGLIQLNTLPSGRTGAGGVRMFDYVATRTPLPFGAPAPTPPRPGMLPASERAVLELVEGLADYGKPLPTVSGMAVIVGMGQARVGEALRRLAARGLIVIHAAAGAPWRVVEIVETGARTGIA